MGGGVVLRWLAAAVATLPLPLAAWLGRRLGDLGYAIVGRRRRLALANLARAFPELTPAARRRLARRSFEHLGMLVTESCFVLGQPPGRVTAQLRLEGIEHLQAVLGRHGRALLLTAHLGNWELLSFAPALTGYPLTVVARAFDSARLGAWADGMRRRAGVEVVDKRDALRPILGALRRGRLVGVLLDQNASRREGVFVPFFGRLASTSRAMAVLALRTGTPVVPAFIRRIAPGRHEITIYPALPLPAPGVDDPVMALTARCTEVIERAVRAAPDQWLWAHDRWRTRPPDEKCADPPK